jgi:DNA polymerase III delta subunit
VRFYDFIDKAPEIGPLVVVEGTDRLLSERALNAIVERSVEPAARDLNVERFSGPELESPAPVEAACSALPFLGTRRVVIVRDAQEMRAAARRAFWEMVQRLPAGNTLVIEDLQSPQKRAKPETFGQLAGANALRIDTTATQPVRARFAREALAQLGATADPPVIAALAAGEADLAAVRTDLEKLALAGHVTLEELLRETLTTADVRIYQVASMLVAGRSAEALAAAFEYFASEGKNSGPPLFAAIAAEYGLVWECARGAELPPRQRWRERELRAVARRLGVRRARAGFERALRACEASVTARVGDPRGVVARLAARGVPAPAAGRERRAPGTTGPADGRRER